MPADKLPAGTADTDLVIPAETADTVPVVPAETADTGPVVPVGTAGTGPVVPAEAAGTVAADNKLAAPEKPVVPDSHSVPVHSAVH